MTTESEPFKEVQQDPDVCSNCFNRKRHRYERNYRLETVYNEDESEWDVEPMPVKGLELTVAGETEIVGGVPDDVYADQNTITIPERGSHRGLRIICDCGFRYVPDHDLASDETWKNRPLNKTDFFDYAENLIERYREDGVTLDENQFFEELDELKSDPTEQFADDRLYQIATSRAQPIVGSTDTSGVRAPA